MSDSFNIGTGAKFPCAMTVDVEDYFHVAAFGQNIKAEEWDNFQSRVVANTQRVLSLFEQHNISATFFILGWVAEKNPELVRIIHDAGHEIASHGYSHQLIYKQTPDEFRQETIKSKQIIEDIIQSPVSGYRGSSYSITKSSTWALDILSECGFEWDSSIFPIIHDTYGIPSSPTKPYLIRTSNGRSIKELPLTTASVFGFRLPAAGGGYFRLFPYFVSRFLLRRACKNGPGIFYFHPWEIDPDQPRVEGASLLSRFRHYNNLDKCLPRLNKLLSDFQFTTVSNALSVYPVEKTEINVTELT